MIKAYGNGQTLAFKKDSEVAGVFAFGITLRSVIREGRTYKNNQGATRLVKEIEIALVMQEGERLLGMLSMVTGGKTMVLPVTENGGITFSTKHTTVDEDGEEEPGSKCTHAFFHNQILHLSRGKVRCRVSQERRQQGAQQQSCAC